MKGIWVTQYFPIFLAFIILSLSIFLSLFTYTIQQEYDRILNLNSSVQLFLIPNSNQWINEEQLILLQQQEGVNAIYPMTETENEALMIDGTTTELVCVYPIISDESSIVVSSDLKHYIGKGCLYNNQRFLIKEVATMRQMALYNAGKQSIFVPIEYMDIKNTLFSGGYMIDYESVLLLENLEDAIANLDIDYELINLNEVHESMVFSFYSQRHLLNYTMNILRMIALILLAFCGATLNFFITLHPFSSKKYYSSTFMPLGLE